MSKKRKSILIKGDYPDMWIPEFLRSPVRIRVFWYQKLWNFFKVVGRFVVKPLEKPESGINPKLSLDGDVVIDGYQPEIGLDQGNPPQGGSGVPPVSTDEKGGVE